MTPLGGTVEANIIRHEGNSVNNEEAPMVRTRASDPLPELIESVGTELEEMTQGDDGQWNVDAPIDLNHNFAAECTQLDDTTYGKMAIT